MESPEARAGRRDKSLVENMLFVYAQLVDPRPVRGGGSEVSGMFCGEVYGLAELWVPPEPHRAGKGRSHWSSGPWSGTCYVDFVEEQLLG